MSSIATNRRDNDRELERRITAVKALDSSRYKSIPILHFEGITDSIFVMNFCKYHHSLKKIKNLEGPTLFVIPIDYSENEKLTKFLDSLEKSYSVK